MYVVILNVIIFNADNVGNNMMSTSAQQYREYT